MQRPRILAALTGSLLIAALALPAAASAHGPTCADFGALGIDGWPPSGGAVGDAARGGGAALPGGPGPGFHFPNGFAPGASFCLPQSAAPGYHAGD